MVRSNTSAIKRIVYINGQHIRLQHSHCIPVNCSIRDDLPTPVGPTITYLNRSEFCVLIELDLFEELTFFENKQTLGVYCDFQL